MLFSLVFSRIGCQVNQEIYSEEDLLAIDSSPEEVIDQVAVETVSDNKGTIVLPPPSFRPDSSNAEVEYSPPGAGSYMFSYSTADGTRRSESGGVSDVSGFQVTGSWEYLGKDGTIYRTVFVSDKRGYRPRIFRIPAAGGGENRQGRKFKKFKNKKPSIRKKKKNILGRG